MGWQIKKFKFDKYFALSSVQATSRVEPPPLASEPLLSKPLLSETTRTQNEVHTEMMRNMIEKDFNDDKSDDFQAKSEPFTEDSLSKLTSLQRTF